MSVRKFEDFREPSMSDDPNKKQNDQSQSGKQGNQSQQTQQNQPNQERKSPTQGGHDTEADQQDDRDRQGQRKAS